MTGSDSCFYKVSADALLLWLCVYTYQQSAKTGVCVLYLSVEPDRHIHLYTFFFLWHIHSFSITQALWDAITGTHTNFTEQTPSTHRKLNELRYRTGGWRVNAALHRHPVTISRALKILAAAPVGRAGPATQHGSHKLDGKRASPAEIFLSTTVCFCTTEWRRCFHPLQLQKEKCFNASSSSVEMVLCLVDEPFH